MIFIFCIFRINFHFSGKKKKKKKLTSFSRVVVLELFFISFFTCFLFYPNVLKTEHILIAELEVPLYRHLK